MAAQLEWSLVLQPADRDLAVLCVRLLLSRGAASQADVILAHCRPGREQDLVMLEQVLATLRTLDQPARAPPVAQRLARQQRQRLFWQVRCGQLPNQPQRPGAALQHCDFAACLRPSQRSTLWALILACLAAGSRLDLGVRALTAFSSPSVRWRRKRRCAWVAGAACAPVSTNEGGAGYLRAGGRVWERTREGR